MVETSVFHSSPARTFEFTILTYVKQWVTRDLYWVQLNAAEAERIHWTNELGTIRRYHHLLQYFARWTNCSNSVVAEWFTITEAMEAICGHGRNWQVLKDDLFVSTGVWAISESKPYHHANRIRQIQRFRAECGRQNSSGFGGPRKVRLRRKTQTSGHHEHMFNRWKLMNSRWLHCWRGNSWCTSCSSSRDVHWTSPLASRWYQQLDDVQSIEICGFSG